MPLPPTVREALLPVYAKMRAFANNQIGSRRFVVYMRRSSPGDARGGIGAVWTNTDTQLTEAPQVRLATPRDVMRWGGAIDDGAYIMERITPRNDANTVGINIGVIDTSPSTPAEKVFVVLTGVGMPTYNPTGGTGSNGFTLNSPMGGGEFTVVGRKTTRTFEFIIALKPAVGRSRDGS